MASCLLNPHRGRRPKKDAIVVCHFTRANRKKVTRNAVVGFFTTVPSYVAPVLRCTRPTVVPSIIIIVISWSVMSTVNE
jgi:hypothetical protein